MPILKPLIAVACVVCPWLWSSAATPDDAASGLAATRLRLLAKKILAQAPESNEASLRAASTLLRFATETHPGDADTWRLRIEADDAAGGSDSLGELLRGYLRANPSDDAAQLLWVETLIWAQQTAAERSATLERIVDSPSSSSLTDAFRARIAWNVAGLAGERGDVVGGRRWLIRSMELDPVFAPPARAAFEMISQDPDSTPMERFQALLVWQAANPIDPDPHARIAQMLLTHGAYEEAALWYGSADRLAAAGEGWDPAGVPEFVGDWSLALWASGHRESALALLGSYESSLEAETSKLPEGLILLRAAILASTGEGAALTEDEQVRLSDPARSILASKLNAATPEATADGARMRELAGRVPESLREIGSGTYRFVGLRVDARNPRLIYAEPVRIRVRVTNLAEISLAIGPEGVIPDTLLLLPEVRTREGDWVAYEPQVIDLRRRLNLGPLRELVVETVLDGPDFVTAMLAVPQEQLQVRVTAVHDPRIGHDGSIGAGPLGTVAVAPRIIRHGAEPTDDRVTSAMGRIGRDDEESMLSAAWLAWVVGTLGEDREDTATRAAAALTDDWQRASPARKIWIAGQLVPGEKTRRRLPRVLDEAVHSPSAAVRCALVAAMTDRADGQELTAVLRLSDLPESAAFAADVQLLFQERPVGNGEEK